MLSTEESVQAAVDYLKKKGKIGPATANIFGDFRTAYIKLECQIDRKKRLANWYKKRSV